MGCCPPEDENALWRNLDRRELNGFIKKEYYNPGKVKSRLVKQLEKYYKQLAESEEKVNELKLRLMDPALASDYQTLMELQTELDAEEHLQESLLERMLETETELEEMEG